MTLKYGNTKDLGGAVKLMCYAPAGYGKTKLCATAPNPLVISTESGLLSLRKDNLPFIEIETLQDFRDARKFVQTSSSAKQFETVCIDSLSDIAESIVLKLKQQVKDPRQAYGLLQDEILTELQLWRRAVSKHTYVTCKQTIIELAAGVTQCAPDMPGQQLPKYMPHWGDELFALRLITNEEGKTERWLQTQPDIQYYAKDRSGELEVFEKPDLTNIFNKILGV